METNGGSVGVSTLGCLDKCMSMYGLVMLVFIYNTDIKVCIWGNSQIIQIQNYSCFYSTHHMYGVFSSGLNKKIWGVPIHRVWALVRYHNGPVDGAYPDIHIKIGVHVFIFRTNPLKNAAARGSIMIQIKGGLQSASSNHQCGFFSYV